MKPIWDIVFPKIGRWRLQYENLEQEYESAQEVIIGQKKKIEEQKQQWEFLQALANLQVECLEFDEWALHDAGFEGKE